MMTLNDDQAAAVLVRQLRDYVSDRVRSSEAAPSRLDLYLLEECAKMLRSLKTGL